MDVVILGAGGHGRVVLDILLQARQHNPVAFLDNNEKLHGRRVDGLPVMGGIDLLQSLRSREIHAAIVAIGDNGVRRGMADVLERHEFELINAVHPSAQIARNASIGKGAVIAAGSLICAHCQIGDNAILNTGCIVDHECIIGTAAHICPGVRLAGHVVIESGVFVGIGATVTQNIRIGYDAIVGAGAVVIRDVEPMSTVVGVPARCLNPASDGERLAEVIGSRPGRVKQKQTALS